jgi:hypothetical protein
MKPKYIQVNCNETDKLDWRQARAVTKYKPDIIILEYPNNQKTPGLPFNKYKALEKPKEMVKKRLKEFPKEVIKIHPWVRTEPTMWKNVANLWAKGHQVLVYAVDAPHELTGEWLEMWRHAYPCIKKNWLWWVQIYLRERIMANHLQWILKHYKEKQEPMTLIFLQDFHWEHVKFLLKNPTRDKIWDYYFGKFPDVNRNNIAREIKKLNQVFYRYWRNFSDF